MLITENAKRASEIAVKIAEHLQIVRHTILDMFGLSIYDDQGFNAPLDVFSDLNHNPKDPNLSDEVWEEFLRTTFTPAFFQLSSPRSNGDNLDAVDQLLNVLGKTASGLPVDHAAYCESLILECRDWMARSFLSEAINAKSVADQLYSWTQKWLECSRLMVAGAELSVDQSQAVTNNANGQLAAVETRSRRPKATTRSNDGANEKCKAYLLHHHNYEKDPFKSEPTTPTQMAKAGIASKASASRFFSEYFEGHKKYVRLCSNPQSLEFRLKVLAGDYTPSDHQRVNGDFREDLQGEADPEPDE